MGTSLAMPAWFVMLADGLGRSGQFSEAFELIEKSINQSERWGERHFEADAFRVKGSLLLGTSSQGEAEQAYLKSMEIARHQEAKMWELRAASDLARLWNDQGRKSQAKDLLSKTHALFTEGFQLPCASGGKPSTQYFALINLLGTECDNEGKPTPLSWCN